MGFLSMRALLMTVCYIGLPIPADVGRRLDRNSAVTVLWSTIGFRERVHIPAIIGELSRLRRQWHSTLNRGEFVQMLCAHGTSAGLMAFIRASFGYWAATMPRGDGSAHREFNRRRFEIER